MKLSTSLRAARAAWLPRWQIVSLTPRAGAGTAAVLALANLVLGSLPVLFVVATSLVLGDVPDAVRGGIGSTAWNHLLQAFAVAAMAFVAQQAAAPLTAVVGEAVARRIDGRIFGDLIGSALRGTGLAALEDQAARDDLRTASEALEFGYFSPGQAYVGLLALLARYGQLLGYVVVVAAFSWLAGVGVALAVLLFRYGHRGGLGKYAQARMDLIGVERKSDYLRQVATEPAAGKEIRVFGLSGWLGAAYRQARLDWLGPLWAHRRRISLKPFLFFGAWGLAVTAAVFVSVGTSASGHLALTRFALVLQAVLGAVRLGEYYPEADIQTAIGMIANTAVEQFSSDVDEIEQRAAAAPPAGRTPPTGEIHFDDVSFGYPGQTRMVFEGLDLRIPLGRSTAVVGLNGAGKTTLVKLLTRLYEPSGGAIRLDGVDIREMPVERWRSRISVIFQEFARYQGTAAENIGFGAVSALGDRAGIRAAAEAVGMLDVLEQLPQGLDTPLGTQSSGGTDLSGGQWQRLALARAVFGLRHGASIVVLDEPTANLDVRAEARFFDESAEVLRGATTLLISHRFSTVRYADLIVVLQDGRIVEQGDHDRLLAENGRYAEMFRAQAENFTDADQSTEKAPA